MNEQPRSSEVPINPYAAPAVETAPVAAEGSPAEVVRKLHIKHEASVKSIGTLFLLGAALLLIMATTVFGLSVASLMSGNNALEVAFATFGGVVYAAIGITQGWTGFALRKLRPWSRIAGIVLSAIGLLGFPIGTIFRPTSCIYCFRRRACSCLAMSIGKSLPPLRTLNTGPRWPSG